eukprot:GEMP01008865.1.p1 GENE.GEMP01008865.1~~GEMP01008865.1.p1  ORF type:complete len:802 (+),score=197.03 GEMP01008865.1:183-2588(+)
MVTSTRLKEVDPVKVGIVVSKRKLVVVQGGTCDFYTIALVTQPASSVVVSIRASLGAVNVRPDTIHFRPDDYGARTIVVLSDTGAGDAQEFGLMHYVTSQMPQLDALVFKLKVFVVEREGGTLLSFGKNDFGQLGHERVATSESQFDQVPRCVSGLPPNAIFRQVAGGVDHSVVLLSDGTVYSWGSSISGACGVVTERRSRLPPTQIQKLDRFFVLQVACGSHHTLVLSNLGDVFFFGDLFHRGDVVMDPSRVKELGPEEKLQVVKIACGESYNACVVQDSVNGLFTWGNGSSGVLGHGDTKDRLTPTRVEKLPECTILDMAAGRFHLVLLTMKGEVIVQGHGDDGRLGLGDENMRLTPVMVPNLPLCRLVAAGAQHTAILDEDLNVWAWGSNQCGQLGLTNRITEFKLSLHPRKLAFFEGKGCCSVQLGDFHSLALTLYGLVYTWGSHDSGQLGRHYGELSGVMYGHHGSNMPVVVEDLMHRPAVQVAGTASGSMTVTVFEYPSANTAKFGSWKRTVKDMDERRRHQCCKAFRSAQRIVHKRDTAKKSCTWEEKEQTKNELKEARRVKQEERRHKAFEFHRNGRFHANVIAKQSESSYNIIRKVPFVEQHCIASELTDIAKAPIGVTLEEFVSDFRKKKEDKQGSAAHRAQYAIAEDQEHASSRTFTYFDPPSDKSFRGMLAGSLGPSDLLKQSAAAFYLINPRRYLLKPGLVASECPGMLKLNAYLANALEPEEFGYVLRSEPLDLSAEDNGDMLETQMDIAGEDKVVTVFGDFFKMDDEDFFATRGSEWGGFGMRVPG